LPACQNTSLVAAQRSTGKAFFFTKISVEAIHGAMFHNVTGTDSVAFGAEALSLPIGTAPREQQRRRNAIAPSSRRHQPRTTQALGDDPQLLLFGPSSPAARIDHLKPFHLRTVRMTGHTHVFNAQLKPGKAVPTGPTGG
jgi:hypothetical protein